MKNLALSMDQYMTLWRAARHGRMPANTTTIHTIKIWRNLSKYRTRIFLKVTSMTAANTSSSLSTTPAFFWNSSLKTLTVLTAAPGWMAGSTRPASLSTLSGSLYRTSSWPSSLSSPNTSYLIRIWPSINSQLSGSTLVSTMETKRISSQASSCTSHTTRFWVPSIKHSDGITSRVLFPLLPYTLNFTNQNKQHLRRPDS